MRRPHEASNGNRFNTSNHRPWWAIAREGCSPVNSGERTTPVPREVSLPNCRPSQETCAATLPRTTAHVTHPESPSHLGTRVHQPLRRGCMWVLRSANLGTPADRCPSTIPRPTRTRTPTAVQRTIHHATDGRTRRSSRLPIFLRGSCQLSRSLKRSSTR